MPSPPLSKTRRNIDPPVLSRALRRLLAAVLVVFGLLAINSLYLVSVTIAGQLSGQSEENYFCLLMFLAHLALGLVLIVPALLFGALHLRRARRRELRKSFLSATVWGWQISRARLSRRPKTTTLSHNKRLSVG